MTGSRGPLPKPNVLKLLSGNPGKRSLNLQDGVNPRVEIPSAPRHLSKEAAKEWKRVTPLLEELGLISGLDRAALALYCQAVGRLTELEMAFNAKIKVHTEAGMDYAEAVYQVSHGLTPNGFAQQSVLFQLLRAHREEVNRYLAHFGLSPAARARVSPSNYLQPELPGMPEAPNAASGFAKFAQPQR
jgi:P27 family predicted phage terminase small subunit